MLLTVIFGFIIIAKGPTIKKVKIVTKNLQSYFDNFGKKNLTCTNHNKYFIYYNNL